MWRLVPATSSWCSMTSVDLCRWRRRPTTPTRAALAAGVKDRSWKRRSGPRTCRSRKHAITSRRCCPTPPITPPSSRVSRSRSRHVWGPWARAGPMPRPRTPSCPEPRSALAEQVVQTLADLCFDPAGHGSEHEAQLDLQVKAIATHREAPAHTSALEMDLVLAAARLRAALHAPFALGLLCPAVSSGPGRFQTQPVLPANEIGRAHV